ncbi:MAG: alpha/beta hydrolase [Betaproteobacteria bacterium]|nr:alpha/beta hydrolase [Betaproteobacteria bacterium]
MNFLVQQQPAYVYTGTRAFDAGKPTIVFIHGSANDHSVWTYQARWFAHHGWNALAPDLPGHGKSFGAPRASVEAYADWIVNLLDNGGIEKAVLVGHSMGSLAVLDCVARYPSRATKAVLIGCGVPMAVSDALLDAARNRPHEAFDMLNLWGHAPQLKWGKNPTPGTSSLMAYKRLLESSAPGVLANDLAACGAYAPDTARLQSATVPVLLLTGTRDLLTPAKAGAALAKQLPNARFVTVPDCGHSLMQEAPAETLKHLRAFLN